MPEILIKNGIILTQNPKREVISNGAVRISDGVIEAVGQTKDLQTDYRADQVLDAQGMVVLPGLINAHVHLRQSLLKGLADCQDFVTWCNRVLYPFYRILKEDYLRGDYRICYYSALMGCLEMISSGTTCFVGMDNPNPGIAEAINNTGIRGVYAISVSDRWTPPDINLPVADQLHAAEGLISKFHRSSNDRLTCMIAPAMTYSCSNDLRRTCLEVSRRYGIKTYTHLAESQFEVDMIRKETGTSPVRYLEDTNFLHPGLIVTHCIWVDEEELLILKKHGVNVVHCPKSNMKLGAGIAPIVTMLRHGIDVGLATDGCASNDNLDMFEEMRIASLLQKLRALDPRAISAQDVLDMATIKGARALGLDASVGSIEQGKKADLIIVDLNQLHLQPFHDPVATLVYCAKGSDVHTVVIDGKVVMENRAVLTFDVLGAIREAVSAAGAAFERLAS